MKLLTKWKSKHSFSDIIFNDDNRIIKISSEVLKTIYKYIQKTNRDFEAGGILLGREDKETNNLIIDFCTEPYYNDKRSKYKFERIDRKHITEYERINSENENIYLYIGEWHTHPEMKPNYSQIDFDNWIKINDEDIYYDNQYQIIAGIEEIRIWKVEKDHKIYNVYNYCWKEFMEEMI